MEIRAVAQSPEFDPAKAPKLDSQKWPEARVLKGHHNYAADYALHAIEAIVKLHGEQSANHIVRVAMNFMAVQFSGQLAKQTGFTDKTAHAAAQCSAAILRSFKNDVELARKSATVTEVSFKTFSPFEAIATEEMRTALFAYFEMSTRVTSGRFAAKRSLDTNIGIEVWRFEDHQTWLQ